MANFIFSVAKNMVLHSTPTVSQQQENSCLEKLDAKIVVPEKATSYSPLKTSEFKEHKVQPKQLSELPIENKFYTINEETTGLKTLKNSENKNTTIESKSIESIKENKVYEPLGSGEPYIPPKPLVLPTPPATYNYISPGNASLQTRVDNNFAYMQASGDYMGARMKAELAWKPFK